MLSYSQLMIACWVAVAFAAALLVVARPRLARTAPMLFKAMLASVALVLACLAAETGVALFYDTTDDLTSSRLHQRWSDRHVRLNEWGFRSNRQYTPSPEPGTRRIALVGDSFAFGQGIANVEDRFGELIEARANARPGTKVEVLSFGQSGAAFPRYFELMADLSKKYRFQADTLLLSHCLNDVEYLIARHFAEVQRLLAGSSLGDSLLGRFFLPDILYLRTSVWRSGAMDIYVRGLKAAYKDAAAFEQHEKMFVRMRDTARATNMELRVVVWPLMLDLDGDYPFEEAHQKLDEFLKRAEIPYVDLLAPMRQRWDEGLTVGLVDGHPNERANSIAADAILNAFPDMITPKPQ